MNSEFYHTIILSLISLIFFSSIALSVFQSCRQTAALQLIKYVVPFFPPVIHALCQIGFAVFVMLTAATLETLKSWLYCIWNLHIAIMAFQQQKKLV